MNINIDTTNICLETDRLTLRAFCENDLSDFYEYASVPGVGEMAGWPHHESIETSKQILQSFLEKKEVFALVLKENKKLIGSLGLHYSWANDDPKYADMKSKEIGYVLSRDYWGRGLVPEAVKAVIAMCFNEYDCDMLTCGHFSTNNQSRRVIEKSGFMFERQSVYHSKQLNKDFDDMKYVLLRSGRSVGTETKDSCVEINAKIKTIKMIVTDLDNTLLRRDKTVSDYTVSVFQRCRDRGIKIVFATARPVRAVAKWLNIDIKNDACIYHNGAVIKIGDEPFQETGIECSIVSKLLETAKQLEGMRIAVETGDKLYANFDASTVWPGVEFVVTNFDDLPKRPADKIIFITTNRTEINEIEQLLDVSLYWEISDNEVLMVMNKDARKRIAICDLVAKFGISLSEVVAFGDDHNDVEMLRECGTGVAVANAIEEAKAAADYICDTNDNDGVAKWLEENVL